MIDLSELSPEQLVLLIAKAKQILYSEAVIVGDELECSQCHKRSVPSLVEDGMTVTHAFEPVSDYLGNGERITEGLIREIQKRLVRSVREEAAAPGEYRRVQNYIVHSISGAVIYTPPPARAQTRARWLAARPSRTVRKTPRVKARKAAQDDI